MNSELKPIILSLVVGCTIAGAFYFCVMKPKPPANEVTAPISIKATKDEIIGKDRTKDLPYGDKDAPYTLVEYGDYECSPCHYANVNIRNLLKANPHRLNYYFRQYPLTFHQHAKELAVASEVSRIGGQFWPFHWQIMDKSQLDVSMASATVKKLKEKSGYQNANLRATQTVDQDMDRAKRFGVNATPTFFLITSHGDVLKLGNLNQAKDLIKAE